MAHDVIVVGAGLSGLVSAILMAETGARVLVLEQHTIPGGYLQQFTRKGTRFDVGFHYTGSTRPGRPLRQFLEHLSVFDRIEWAPFPDDAAIEVRAAGRAFAYPTRFDAFLEKAFATWPHEAEGLERLGRETEEICTSHRWFDLRLGRDYTLFEPPASNGESLQAWLEGCIEDPWLREVLSAQSFNLGLFPHEIPWGKHALAFRANFDDTTRMQGGGGALVRALIERGEELGVEYRFREEVVRMEADRRTVAAVHTARGERLEAAQFIAACHPKVVVRSLDEKALTPLFRNHVLRMRDSRGALQVFLRLRAPLSSIGATCLLLKSEGLVDGEPDGPLLVTYPSSVERDEPGGPRLEAMGYVAEAPFAAWRDLPVLRRGPEYEGKKEVLAQRMVDAIAREVPELEGNIEDVYSATPLSDAWYTKNDHGGVFGVSHDVHQQGRDRPNSRLRLRNLLFTGHSIDMPGICGVFINAFQTCDRLRGDDRLFQAVARQ